MNLSFSFALNSSFPHIGRNGTGFRTSANSFGHPMPSSFHNCMAKSSLRLHKTSIGYTLCYISGYLTHKKPKQMHLHMTNKDIWAIVQISIDPRFEIKDFLNELWNEWMILGKHECFHQIRHDIIILLSQIFQQISKISINIFMCVPNHKKPHLKFFENFTGS